MISRFCCSCLALAVVLQSGVTLCLGQPTLAKKPINFVFFLVDDLGYMDIGANNDLAKKYPLRVKAMREKLHAWYREVDAKFLRQREKSGDSPKPWRPSDEAE